MQRNFEEYFRDILEQDPVSPTLIEEDARDWESDIEVAATRTDYSQYLFNQYDWETFDCADNFALELTQGYFAFVSVGKKGNEVKKRKWSTNIQRNKYGEIIRIYAYRNATKKERARGAPAKIYLHRFMKGVVYKSSSVVIDHRNGCGLDNRNENLNDTNASGNGGNTGSKYRSVHDLPRGVEPVRSLYKSKKPGDKREVRKITGYKGCIKVRSKAIRSKSVYRSPERAAKWYERVHKVLFPECANFMPPDVEHVYPPFPPKLPEFDDTIPF